MNRKIIYKVFIWTFVLLYVGTATISYFHSIEFFGIGNGGWMPYVLGLIFEIGQAAVLASLLISDNKKTILPWLLMILLTATQVVGNVYSTYKFIALSETEYYQYLAKPLLFWVQGLTEETVMIIVSWIIGGLLPIVALAMTSMVMNNMKLQNGGTEPETTEQIENPEPEPTQEKKEEKKEEKKTDDPVGERISSIFSKKRNKKEKIQQEESTETEKPVFNPHGEFAR